MITSWWCSNVAVLSDSYSHHVEHVTVKCHLFYLSRVLSSIIIIAVHILPQADVWLAFEELCAMLNKHHSGIPRCLLPHCWGLQASLIEEDTFKLLLAQHLHHQRIIPLTTATPPSETPLVPSLISTLANVRISFMRVNPQKASSPDGVPGHVLKACMD